MSNASDNQSNYTTIILIGLVGFGFFGNMRIIPAAFDLALISLVLSSIKKVGNIEIQYDSIQPQVLKWMVLQSIFLGDRMLDMMIFICKRYPQTFKQKTQNESEEQEKSVVCEDKSFLRYALNAIPDLNLRGLSGIQESSILPSKSLSPLKKDVRKRASSDIMKQ